MKKTIILSAAALIALAACVKEKDCTPLREVAVTKTLTVENGAWEQTKTAYTEGVGVAITGTEKITVYGNKYEEGQTLYNTDVFTAVAATPGSDGYTFTHDAISGAESYNYFFVLPHKTSSQRGGTPKIPNVKLFPVQYPAAGSYDPFCDILIGKPAVNVPKAGTVEVNEWMRLGAPVRMMIKDEENLLGGEAISLASIYFPSAPAPLAAFFSVKNSVNYDEVVITKVNDTKCYGLTAIYPDGVTKSGSAYETWFVSFPVEFAASQQVELLVSTTSKTLKFKTTLASALGFEQDRLNGLTFALTSAKQVGDAENSFVTCFTSLPRTSSTIPSSIASTDGTSRSWNFSSCDLKTSEADGRAYLRTKGAAGTVNFPNIPGKYYTSIRIYPGETLYTSSGTLTNLSLCSNGVEIQNKSMCYYKRDLSEKGYVEFSGITEEQSNLSVTVSYSDNGSHENLIGAISCSYADISGHDDPTPSEEIDYYTMYNNGEDIQIGDLIVNKSTYGNAVLVEPSSLTYSPLQAGGVVFLDDKTGASVNPGSVAANATKGLATGSKELILIGRYGNIGKQTEIKVPEWRVNKSDVTIFNVALSCMGGTAEMFGMDSGSTTTPAVRIVNCFIDQGTPTSSSTNISIFLCTNTCTGNKGYGHFRELYLENNIVKLTNTTGKNPVIFYHGTSNLGNFTGDQVYTLKNCVVFCETQMLGRLAYISTKSGQFDNSNLEFVCENNTFYNLATGGAYMESYNLKGVSFTNNVGHLDYSNFDGSKPYSSKIWLMYGADVSGSFNLSNNKFYRENNPGNGVWVLKHSDSKTDFTGSDNEIINGNPFKAVNVSCGYLPLLDALSGYGASYSDKTFITVE